MLETWLIDSAGRRQRSFNCIPCFQNQNSVTFTIQFVCWPASIFPFIATGRRKRVHGTARDKSRIKILSLLWSPTRSGIFREREIIYRTIFFLFHHALIMEVSGESLKGPKTPISKPSDYRSDWDYSWLHKSGRFFIFGDPTAITSFASTVKKSCVRERSKQEYNAAANLKFQPKPFYRFIMLFHVICLNFYFSLGFLRNWALDHAVFPSSHTSLARISNSISPSTAFQVWWWLFKSLSLAEHRWWKSARAKKGKPFQGILTSCATETCGDSLDGCEIDGRSGVSEMLHSVKCPVILEKKLTWSLHVTIISFLEWFLLELLHYGKRLQRPRLLM